MGLKVYARIKDGNLNIYSKNENNCIVKIPTKVKNHSDNYKLNHIWQKDSNNTQIFNKLMMDCRFNNENYWIAFGYTGSGKSYTITGLLECLLSFYRSHQQVNISAYQIYNEKIFDMFNKNKKLKCWKAKTLVIRGLKTIHVTNIEQVLNTIKERRVLASTEMNSISSRSHAIMIVTCGNKRYVLVDMAGQESGKTAMLQDNDRIKKEGTDINLNMLALKDCITHANKNRQHIPYRRCLLTMAIKNMFDRTSNISFICTLSMLQDKFYLNDTIKYASALYYDSDEKAKEKINHEMAQEFTEYLTDVKYYQAQELTLFMDVKAGNFNKFPQVISYIDKQVASMLGFKSKAQKYMDKLPKIDT